MVRNCPLFYFLGEQLSGEHLSCEQLSGEHLSCEQLFGEQLSVIRIYGDVSMWVHLWGVSMGCIYGGVIGPWLIST